MPVTYEPIATTTLGSATNPITFSSIPGTYTDLRIVFLTSSVSSSDWVRIRFNGDTSGSTLYSYNSLNGYGDSVDSSNSVNSSSLLLGYPSNVQPCLMTVDIFSYAGSTKKTTVTTQSMDANGSGTVRRMVSVYNNTSAITSLVISMDAGTFSVGTRATLYGIKAA